MRDETLGHILTIEFMTIETETQTCKNLLIQSYIYIYIYIYTHIYSDFPKSPVGQAFRTK